MEKSVTNSVICPVCSLFLREGISLKNHLQTHSKEKVIEALLKQELLCSDSAENVTEFTVHNNNETASSINPESSSLPVTENRIFGLNDNAVTVIPSTSTLVESSNNQINQPTPSISYESQAGSLQCVNSIQFPASSLNNNLINQNSVANTCNTFTYHQFITGDGNIVLIPVYNIGPPSVVVPNNIVPSSIVNPCVVVPPPTPIQPLNIMNPEGTLTAANLFGSPSSSVMSSGAVAQNANILANGPASGNDSSSGSVRDCTNTLKSAGDHVDEDEDEKDTDDEVANIFDPSLNDRRQPCGDRKQTSDDEDEDDKSSCLSTLAEDVCSSPHGDDVDITTDNVELNERNEVVTTAAGSAVSVIRVRSDLNYESDGSPMHNSEEHEAPMMTLDADYTNSSTKKQYLSIEKSSSISAPTINTNKSITFDSLPVPNEAVACSDTPSLSHGHGSAYNIKLERKCAGALASPSAPTNQNQFDFVLSNSDNATHILPDAAADDKGESLHGIPRRDTDQYILPNDEFPAGPCSYNSSNAAAAHAGTGSDCNFLGIRNSFLSSVSLLSSVNKAMFADVDVYNSVKNQTSLVEVIPGDLIAQSSGMKNEELSVIVKGQKSNCISQDEEMESCSKTGDNLESPGNSRISPFNIQTDESMPPRGELSGQESLSGTENSLWELQMLQRSKNFDSEFIGESEDLKTGLNSIIRSADSEIYATNYESAKRENEVTIGSEIRRSSDKKAVRREFICLYCRSKFDSWKQRQSHVGECHSEEDGLTTESLFGKRLQCKLETVKSEEELESEAAAASDVTADTPDLIMCRICSDTFQTSIDFIKHLKEFHGIRKRSCVCPTCFTRFTNANEYQQHIQKVHPYECMTCGKKFYTRPGYMLHQKRHMKLKPYSCNECDKAFVTKQKLTEHMNVHTGEKPIKCELCECQFKRYSNYQQHKKFLHLNHKRKLKDFVCAACGEVFHSKVKLQWHQEIHDEKPKQCPFCVERFVHAASLTRHVRKWHNETYVAEWATKRKSNSLVACPVCSVAYLRSSLAAHMKIHDDEKPFACAECSRRFRTKWNLQLHRWTHVSRSAKPFKCKLCVKAYVHKTDYDAHMRSHNNCRPYACNVCGRQFIRKYNCIRHMREHKEPRAHKCNVCGKLFSRSYYLTEHEKVHTGEKPHVCHICGKSSATKSNHNKHVKMHNVVRESVNSES